MESQPKLATSYSSTDSVKRNSGIWGPVRRFGKAGLLRFYPNKEVVSFVLHLSFSMGFPSAGLSAAHFRADWLRDWSLAAKWPRLLITQLTAAYPPHQRSKCDEGWASLK